jgi:hypothetical protein
MFETKVLVDVRLRLSARTGLSKILQSLQSQTNLFLGC